ncbi:hypothetical protein G6F57_018204 [Rhizopus arrhizus]|nr:hypothetical protein G6F57_018204 [Rhizopus arrhizus]
MYQQSPVSATNLVTSLNQKINDGLNDLWQRQEAVRSTISYPMSHDSKLFRKIDNISVNKFARLFVVETPMGPGEDDRNRLEYGPEGYLTLSGGRAETEMKVEVKGPKEGPYPNA